MHHSVLCAVLVCLATSAVAAETGDAADVTVFMQFEGETSSRSVEALRKEVTKLLKPANIDFEYRIGSELGPGDTPTDIIVVRFKGRCREPIATPLLDERGSFAFTHVSDGEILPFAEVQCDRIRASINSLLGTVHAVRGDQMVGRALGRVLAHEIYHILAKTPHHGGSGVARRGMSGMDLVAENLLFHGDDLRKLHRRALRNR